MNEGKNLIFKGFNKPRAFKNRGKLSKVVILNT